MERTDRGSRAVTRCVEGQKRRPRVTACLPAWNSAACISPVLASLAAQTYPNLTLLISVDACNDGTGEICDAFASANPRVSVIRQTVRLGWVANTNALLRVADGDYLFFASHDDPLQPEYIERLVDALEGAPVAVLAFCDVESTLGSFRYDELDGIHDRFERARRILLQRGPWWVPKRGLIRAGAAKALGGMQRHLAGEVSADLPWLLRLALRGSFVRVPAPLVAKTFRHDSLSASWRKDTFGRLAVMLACVDVIRTAGFPIGQTLRLYQEAVRCAVGIELWNLKERFRSSAGAAGRVVIAASNHTS
jgi:glycosyltransferase involved in cell wall biosynthesis